MQRKIQCINMFIVKIKSHFEKFNNTYYNKYTIILYSFSKLYLILQILQFSFIKLHNTNDTNFNSNCIYLYNLNLNLME